MHTHRETIMAKIASIIEAAGVSVFRSRAEALARDELPAAIIKPGTEQTVRMSRDRYQRTFTILIDVHARANSTPGSEQTADQAADQVIATMHPRLFVDLTLGGIVADLFDKETQEPQLVDGDETRTEVTWQIEAVYATKGSDISTFVNH